jgi:hypothetical protein
MVGTNSLPPCRCATGGRAGDEGDSLPLCNGGRVRDGGHVTLELNKVIDQVDALASSTASAMAQAGELLDEVRGWLHKYANRFEELKARASEFGAAIPTDEPLDATHPAPAMPERFTVIGADGSAIPPDRHSTALYYLINTASLTYRHGSGQQPIAFSTPDLRYTTENLYEGRLLVQGNLLDVRRDTAEIARLADAAEAEAEPRDVPLVALTDGTLLLWVLEESPEELRRKKVADYVRHLDRLRQVGAAPGAFISRPRYPDVLRLVWLAQLGEHASRQAMEDNPFLGLADRSLFDFLTPGQRSAYFVSPSPVNRSYAEVGHSIGFFYVNVGDEGQTEIARVETPEWVYQSPALLDRLHGAIIGQCQLVTPYPYVLARAHELAVITTDERRQLESFIESALLRHGVQGQPSQKALLKSLTGGAKRAFRK